VIVVSNTSPVTNLAAIGQLDLLRRIYGAVLLPRAVLDELNRGPNQPPVAEAETRGWISVMPVANKALVASLLVDLDAGEAEAIALAVESHADLLLIDERLGRQVAARFGLKTVGILGVLLKAKHDGHVASVKSAMDALKLEAGFYVDDELYQAVLRTAGEACGGNEVTS
jgi:uncharacterized protein